MKDIINLPNLKVLCANKEAKQIIIFCELLTDTKICIHCNSTELSNIGTRYKTILDVPTQGRHTKLTIKRGRYYCKCCDKTFLASIECKDNKRQMTNRLLNYINTEAKHRSQTDIAKEVGINKATVCNILKTD